MATVLVLGDSDDHVIGVLQRPDENYTDAREEARRTPGVAFTAIVDFADPALSEQDLLTVLLRQEQLRHFHP